MFTCKNNNTYIFYCANYPLSEHGTLVHKRVHIPFTWLINKTRRSNIGSYADINFD